MGQTKAVMGGWQTEKVCDLEPGQSAQPMQCRREFMNRAVKNVEK